jgi:septal ring factor EnvC (AmiA/AmiB activator)
MKVRGFWLVLGLLAAVLAATAGGANERDPAKAEAELRQVRQRIERIRDQVSRDALERDRLARELKTAEQSVGDARQELVRLRRERGERQTRRAELARERREREQKLAAERDALAGQIRAAHLIGREEPLKLLLNQRDPASVGRMFTYYEYFGRARAGQIKSIEEQVARLDALTAEVAAEDERLASLEQAQRSEVGRLQAARDRRGKVLATLASETKSRQRELDRLQRQQGSLERLLREIRRAMERLERVPIPSGDPFAKLRGKLAWPVTGRVVARFGETRVGGIKWDGMLVAAEQGTPVRAIYGGRIVYADWLPGLGLLAIVDHGDGYLSLYGHNERLFKAVGDKVSAGDQIATVGDTGGRSRPELYFEIRKGGKPVDPRPWFRRKDPG